MLWISKTLSTVTLVTQWGFYDDPICDEMNFEDVAKIGEYLTTAKHSKAGISINMMTSSNGNIFRVTGPLCGEFTGRRWIPLTKASDAEL